MEYKVVNKVGQKLYFDYICFGLLSQLDCFTSTGGVMLGEDDEELVELKYAKTTTVVDNWGKHVYIKGFEPAELKELVYITPWYGRDGLQNFLEDSINKAISHPILSGVTTRRGKRDKLEVVFDMESSRMDETMLKAFLIRNLCESTGRIKTLKELLEKGVPFFTSFFIIQNYYFTYGFGDKYLQEDFEDGSVLYDDYGNVGDLISAILGDTPDYKDDHWCDTIGGYSSEGYRCVPKSVYNEDREDEWWAENELPSFFEERYPQSINTLLCYKTKKDYPVPLQSSLVSLRREGEGDEELFFNFARAIHERTEEERSRRAAEIQNQ